MKPEATPKPTTHTGSMVQEPKTNPKKPKSNGALPPTRVPNFTHGSHVELGKVLLDELETGSGGKLYLPVYDEGGLYHYEVSRGIWAQVSDNEAGVIVQSFDGYQLSEKHFIKLKDSDVKGALACARREATHDGFFADAPPGLAFKDYVVQVDKKGVIRRSPHSPEHRMRFVYPFDYIDDEPTLFLAALRGMFKPDIDAEAKIQLIGEFAGASLLGVATRLQRWLLLRGLGDDGKSTIIDMLRGAMPPGTTCSIKPENLEDEYSRADLAGKLLNTVTEVKQRDILDAETLKAITVGDEMRGRHIRQNWISFRPRAGHIFAANGYPRFSDNSHGFWRRPIVLTFNRCFTGDPERTVGLSETVMAAEHAQVVCWLIRHGANALARGGYVEPESHKGALKEWRGQTDPVFEFIEQRCVVASHPMPSPSNGWSLPMTLFNEFLLWVRETGHRPMSLTGFGRRLSELGHAAQHAGNGKRMRPLRLLKPDDIKKPDGTLPSN